MTVAQRDLSSYDGAPVTLYQFWRRSVPTFIGSPVITYWRYTSADRDYTFDGHLWRAVPVLDDGVRQSGDSTSDQLTITMPASEDIPQMFVGAPPSDPINCSILRTHAGETDAFLAWVGLVGAVSRAKDNLSATLSCNTLSATMDRSGLRLAWGRNCPHALYDSECRADPRLFYRDGLITALDGINVVAAGFATAPPGQLAGGYIEWLDTHGHAERRGIVQHDGATIRLLGTTDRLAVGMTIHAFYGCARTRQVCADVFDNLVNFGGHAYMPDTNPFSGDLIF